MENRNEYARAWYAAHREHYKNYRLKEKFGLSRLEYDTLLQMQGGVCAICSRPESRKTHSLAVDHNHQTGKVRGLLCSCCNRLVGRLEDPKGQAALQYLEGR